MRQFLFYQLCKETNLPFIQSLCRESGTTLMQFTKQRRIIDRATLIGDLDALLNEHAERKMFETICLTFKAGDDRRSQ